jgi:hypothetical protein
MASYNFVRPVSIPKRQVFDKVGTGIPTPVLRKFFCQRAWNVAWAMYETWVSEGEPDPSPPSGNVVTGLTTAAFWKMVV